MIPLIIYIVALTGGVSKADMNQIVLNACESNENYKLIDTKSTYNIMNHNVFGDNTKRYIGYCYKFVDFPITNPSATYDHLKNQRFFINGCLEMEFIKKIVYNFTLLTLKDCVIYYDGASKDKKLQYFSLSEDCESIRQHRISFSEENNNSNTKFPRQYIVVTKFNTGSDLTINYRIYLEMNEFIQYDFNFVIDSYKLPNILLSEVTLCVIAALIIILPMSYLISQAIKQLKIR